MNIKGSTIILTGAKRIGVTVASDLISKGANLAIVYNSSKEEAEQIAAEAKEKGAKAILIQADLSREEDIKKVVNEALSEFGSVDALIHMASPYPKTPLGQITMDQFDSVMKNIAGSALLLAQEVSKNMKQGKIILFSDWSVLRHPFKDYVVYNGAKAAIDSVTKSLAVELAPNIMVNAIAPGPILRPPDLTDDENEQVVAQTPLRKWGGPEVISQAVMYLLESDFTTGVILPVDGGRSVA